MTNKLIYDWKFIKDNVDGAFEENFDDSNWRTIRIPHDYAVEGPFNPENDKQVQEVIADGILKPIVHVGRTGALPIADCAWYRRKFTVKKDTKRAFLEFDGVMSNSTIYVNGKKCGGRVYGYSSFSVDITNCMKVGQENTLAVFVDPKPSSSRWYTGAGIYRDVRLVEKQDVYLPYCPVFVRSTVKKGSAYIDIDVDVCNYDNRYELEYIIYDEDGNIVSSEKKLYSTDKAYNIFKLDDFKYWNVYNAYLYNLKVILSIDGVIYDEYNTEFGIRTIEFDSNKGFLLNGKVTKINGVCMHHDLGALGGAFNRVAAERQIKKLIDIGVNGYRCAHNPPDPQVLELCDRYGLLVMDEAFDEWTIAKVKNGYSNHFEKCAEEDLTDMIRRDRNHPSIIMWSIGNEILEQQEEDGWKVTRYLHNICKKVDSTRPTTAGLSMTLDAFKNGLAEEVDLAGINYKPHLYETLHKEYPNVVLFGSETGSTVSSRGFFRQPAVVEHPVEAKEDFKESSYELASPNWAYPIERELIAQEKYDYVFGHFVWTGFDYLGEPTPYRNNWPARSSYFGIYDLAGMKKDRAYLFMSCWTDKKFIHLLPHWNWNEGQLIDVHAYSNYDKAELFLNGKSLGIQSKNPDDEIGSHRIIWKGVPFESGELKVVAVENPEVTDVVRTAGKPYRVEIKPEKYEIMCDGDDLVYVECTIVDENGTTCPNAELKLNFDVQGAGEYLASDNGNQASSRTFSEKYCETFSGKCMVIIRSIKGQCGEIHLNVTSDELGEQSVILEAY